MGAILQLPTDCLAAPNRAHVAVVEATMLWPHDEVAREQSIVASKIECLLDIGEQLSREDLLALALIQREAPRIRDIRQSARARLVDGVRAGKYLQETVGLIAIDRPAKMSSIASRISTGLAPTAPSIDVKTFENHVWKKYRPVAHLWAASLDLQFDHDVIGTAPFPCKAEELGSFLAIAEAYRRLGEGTRARQSRHSVLDPDETLKLPHDLEVAEITLNFELRAIAK